MTIVILTVLYRGGSLWGQNRCVHGSHRVIDPKEIWKAKGSRGVLGSRHVVCLECHASAERDEEEMVEGR
jgi:hypothetical protein